MNATAVPFKWLPYSVLRPLAIAVSLSELPTPHDAVSTVYRRVENCAIYG